MSLSQRKLDNLISEKMNLFLTENQNPVTHSARLAIGRYLDSQSETDFEELKKQIHDIEKLRLHEIFFDQFKTKKANWSKASQVEKLDRQRTTKQAIEKYISNNGSKYERFGR